DLDQPVVRALGPLAAGERAVGAEEGGLGDVLCVGLVVQDGERVSVDGVEVLLVKALESAVSPWSLHERGGHWCLDADGRGFLRFCLATSVERSRLGGGYPFVRDHVDGFGAPLQHLRAFWAGRLHRGWRVELFPTQGWGH